MSSSLPPKSRADQMAGMLRASLRRRRPRPALIVGAVLLLAVALLGGIAWSLYRWQEPPPVQVIALDVLAAGDTPPFAQARLVHPSGLDVPVAVSGQRVVFLESRGAAPRQDSAKTDDGGYARVNWPLEAGEAEFLVRHVDVAAKRGSVDRGRVFRWERRGPIVVVESDLPPEAGPGLRAGARDGARFVYVAPDQTWEETQATRGRLETLFRARDGFPRGPVLTPQNYPTAADATGLRQAVLHDVRAHLEGRLVAVVATRLALEDYRAEKVAVVWFGREGPAEAVAQAATAAELGERLGALLGGKEKPPPEGRAGAGVKAAGEGRP